MEEGNIDYVWSDNIDQSLEALSELSFNLRMNKGSHS